jgi:hypothetical protein
MASFLGRSILLLCVLIGCNTVASAVESVDYFEVVAVTPSRVIEPSRTAAVPNANAPGVFAGEPHKNFTRS